MESAADGRGGATNEGNSVHFQCFLILSRCQVGKISFRILLHAGPTNRMASNTAQYCGGVKRTLWTWFAFFRRNNVLRNASVSAGVEVGLGCGTKLWLSVRNHVIRILAVFQSGRKLRLILSHLWIPQLVTASVTIQYSAGVKTSFCGLLRRGGRDGCLTGRTADLE